MCAPCATIPIRIHAGAQLVAAAACVEGRRVERHTGIFSALVVGNLPDELSIIRRGLKLVKTLLVALQLLDMDVQESRMTLTRLP